MDNKLNALALGYTGAVLSGIGMLLLGILGNLGIYTGAVEIMQQGHVFFSLSLLGIITGIIEAAIISFVFLYLFGLVYNQFNKS